MSSCYTGDVIEMKQQPGAQTMNPQWQHFEYAVSELNRIQPTQYTYNECCGDYDLKPAIPTKAMSFVFCHPHYGFEERRAWKVEDMTNQVLHEIARINQEDNRCTKQ